MGESALSLVARLVSRPVLFKHYSVFQEDGLRPKEVVELNGEAGVGKSLILLDLIRKCILPKDYGGFEAGIIFIDISCQFSIFQLASMLESDILEKVNANSEEKAEKSDLKALNKVIETSLNRLNIFTCSDLETLFLLFHYFKNFLISNPNVGVIILDNISEFYWREVPFSKELRKMDTFVSNILNYLQSQLGSFNISFIYTRPSYFYSRNSDAVSCSPLLNLKSVNTSVNISIVKKDETIQYSAEVKNDRCNFVKTFEICKDGRITWL